MKDSKSMDANTKNIFISNLKKAHKRHDKFKEYGCKLKKHILFKFEKGSKSMKNSKSMKQAQKTYFFQTKSQKT